MISLRDVLAIFVRAAELIALLILLGFHLLWHGAWRRQLMAGYLKFKERSHG